jgi:uncharacterized protein with PIN domain
LNHNSATFRFYAELNDFLPAEKHQRASVYTFRGTPAVKDAIEAQGVPHTEVDLLLVNGASVGFDYQLRHGDRVSVYPVFESLDISPIVRLRESPLRRTAFVLDVHLGKLARLLRLLGFDATYRNDYQDHEIVEQALAEHRIILTRDVGLLKHSRVSHGYWIRATDPLAQAREVLARFDLWEQVRPLTRCLQCGGHLESVARELVADRVPAHVLVEQEEFWRCAACRQIYWAGSHLEKLQAEIAKMLA